MQAEEAFRLLRSMCFCKNTYIYIERERERFPRTNSGKSMVSRVGDIEDDNHEVRIEGGLSNKSSNKLRKVDGYSR